MKTKKIINDGANAVDEMLEGALAAHSAKVFALGHYSPRSMIARDGPRPGKVGMVIGGGSGHEPSFLGFVGKGLADAAAIGNVFASPPPDPIIECTKAVNNGAGVLYMYGNYAGDVMNFDMAAEMVAMEDIEVRTVLTTDDVASAPADQRDKRRGVAGNVFVFKAAGAACDKMLPIDECERIARKANDRTFTFGVALSPCSLPQTLKPNFTLGEDEMEVGMGIHGEPGISKEKLKPADAITDELMDKILDEMAAPKGDRVAVIAQFARLNASHGIIYHDAAGEKTARSGRACAALEPCRQLLHLVGDGRRFDYRHASGRGIAGDDRSSVRLRHVSGGLINERNYRCKSDFHVCGNRQGHG